MDGGGLVGNPYRWTGRRWDAEFGLYHHRARAYSPDLGRFLWRDPPGIWNDAFNRGNPYAYGGANPFLGVDPTGEDFGDFVKQVFKGLAGLNDGANDAVTFGLWSKAKGTAMDAICGEGTTQRIHQSKTYSVAYTVGDLAGRAVLMGTGLGEVKAGLAGIRGGSVLLRTVSAEAAGGTSRAACRDAMRQNNTPTSRATVEQSGTGGRRQTVVEGSDGRPRVQTQHLADKNHPKPHWHDGKPKVDLDTGRPIRNRRGQIKDQSRGRSTSEYDG